MNPLFFPELFYQVIINLNDKEKIFLTSCSEITHRFKSLIKLDSEYDLEEINDKWCARNIIINNFTLEDKIKELIKNSVTESIIVSFNLNYIKFISNNINIKLFLFNGGKRLEKIISLGCHYMVMKIMLNNNESIKNVNDQFIKASKYGYIEVIKLLIDLGADIHAEDDQAIINASWEGHLSVVKLLIKLGANIHAQDNEAIVSASYQGNFSVAKLLIELGADIRAQDNDSISSASSYGHLSIVKLLIESGANVCAQDNYAIIWASNYGHLSVVKLLIESGANVHARNNKALKYAIRNKHTDVIKLLEDNYKNINS